MEINVRLHGILRDQLPSEAKGRAMIQLPEGASVRDLLDQLGIQRQVIVAVNDESEIDPATELNEGDQVIVFSSISGG